MRIRFISFLLVFSILFSAFSCYSVSDEEMYVQAEVVPETTEYIPKTLQELYKQDCLDSISDSILLDYIDKSLLENSEVVARLDAFEDLNTYVFLNYDGTQTVYYLNDNVKYLDKDGNVIEKDLSLVKTDNGYRTKQNDVGLFMPDDLSDGIVLSFGDRNICIKPVDYKAGKASVSGNTLIYSDIRYTPTIDGVKEEIVLSTRPEDGTVYSFFIDSGGMKLYEDESGLYLADTEDGEERFVIGNIFMYDSLLRFSEGTVTAEEYEDGYILTVIPDYEFLADASYPVIIDPSIDFSDNTHGSNAIQDAPVFSGRPNGNAGNYLYNRVGAGNDDYAIGRTAVRLQSLITNSYYTSATANNISSVTLYIKDASGSSPTTLKLYALANTTWTETGVTWNNIGTIGSTAYETNTSLSYGNWTSFDITDLVKAWKNGTENANAGFIIKGNDENTVKDKSFISSEYTSDTSARPYVRFTYSAATLSLSSYTLDLAEGETNQLTAITYPPSASITWASLNTTYATVSNTGLVTGIKAGTTSVCAFDGTNLAVCTVRVHVPDGVYSFRNYGSQCYLSVDENVLFSDAYQSAMRTDNKAQLWHVEHIGAGQEKISPVYKPELMLQSDSTNNVFVSGSGTSYWSFEWAASGYRFKKGTGSQLVQPSSFTNESGVSVVAGASSSSNYTLWVLQSQNSAKCGIYFYDTESGEILSETEKIYIAPEETIFLSDVDIAVYVYDSLNINCNQVFPVVVNCSSKCSVELSNRDIKLTGIEKGQTYVNVIAAVENSYRYAGLYVQVTEIPNGMYFMQNRQNNKWAKVYQDNAVNNQNVVQYDFNGLESEMWWFQLFDNRTGYYVIRSMNSGFGLYLLGVKLDSTVSNAQIVLRDANDYITDGMLWRIESTSEGAYRLIPKTGDNADDLLVLATSTSGTSNNQNLIQGEYIDNTSYRDEWYLYNNTSYIDSTLDFDAYFLSITHTGTDAFDTWSGMESSFKYLQLAGYDKFCIRRKDNYSKSNCLDEISRARIAVIGSHGGSVSNSSGVQIGTRMILEDKHNYTQNTINNAEFLNSNDIYSISSVLTRNFQNVELVIFMGCETAAGAPTLPNLCSAIVSSTSINGYEGANSAIGFKTKIHHDSSTGVLQSEEWLKSFFYKYCMSSVSLETCIAYALDEVSFSDRYGLCGFDSACIYYN